MRTSRRGAVSLRALSFALVALIGGLAVTMITGLVLASSRLDASLAIIERDTRGVTFAAEIDRSLREYHRLANLWVAERDAAHDEARAALESNLDRLLTEAALHADGDRIEVAIVSELTRDAEAYLETRHDLEARGLAIEELIPTVRPAIARALAAADAFARYQRDQLRRNQAAASEFARNLITGASIAGALLLGCLVLVLIGMQQLVLHPLSEVGQAMDRFRGGDTDARAKTVGCRETADIAGTFNTMAETIRHRRELMLVFLAGIAHDLRNPIAALKLSWQSMMRSPGPLETMQIERLDRQLDRLTRMVDDLLDAVRIEAGQLALELEDMDLRHCAREMVELYQLTSPAHAVRLDIPDRPVEIRADPLRVEQVLSNLLSNAIKYSPGGPVVVRVRVVGDEAELTVSDHGFGIAAEDLPNLFVPFRRGTGTKGVSPGAGLGLSVVHRIVTAHGGRIDVDSSLGEGSTFCVHLPLARTTEEAERQP